MKAYGGHAGARHKYRNSFEFDEYGLREGNDDDTSMDLDIPSILAAKIDTLPSLPAVVTQVIQTIASPKSTVEDLNRIISSDVSLTATILKVANSAFFGFSRKVSSLEQALKLLGFAEVQNLILTKAVFNSFKNTKNNGKFDIRRFWEHAFLCGLAARLLGKTAGIKGADLFVAGLIHDIGKLVLYTVLPAQFSEILEMAGTIDSMTSNAERSLIGYAHDKVGMDLLQRWMFPKNLVTAVGFHHRPKETTEHTLLATLVYLADLMAHFATQWEASEGEPLVKKELLHPDTVALCRSQGLEWNGPVCGRVLKELFESKEAEWPTISVFFS